MKSLIFLLLFVGLALADDKSSCENKCEAKFAEPTVKTACDFGCESRASMTQGGPFSFVDCHKKCDVKFENNSNDSEGCHFACSLPYTSSVFMTMDFNSEDGKPRWKVVKQEGDESALSSFPDFSRESSLLRNILQPQDMNGDIMQFGQPSEPLFSRNMQEMHSRVEKMFADFMSDFQRKAFSNNMAVERPNGHDSWANRGEQVGNTGSDGRPIILTKPLDFEGSNTGDGRAFMIEFRREKHDRHHLLAAFHWSLIGVGVAALLTTLCAIAVFLRNIKANSYRRMRGEGVNPVFSRVQPTSPGELPVKKVPEEGWVDSSEPTGVPPPAYDQVSIHSLKKKDEDSEQPTTASPSH